MATPLVRWNARRVSAASIALYLDKACRQNANFRGFSAFAIFSLIG
jgi:hypothetical protein